MNNSKPHTSGKSIIKSVVFFLVIVLYLFIIFELSALLFDFMSEFLSRTRLVVLLAGEIILIIALFNIILKIFKSIDKINHKAEMLAQGKLNINDILREDARGLEVLTIAFNDMKYNLLSFIESTKVNIVTISDAIESVSKSMNNSYLSNEQIAASMGNVAGKAQEQSKLMIDTTSRIEEVGKRIENITTSIGEVEQSVEKTVQATAVGAQHLDDYYQQVNIISDNLNNTSDYIKKLNEDITQIDQIGKFIIKISEQLKLLGLNASVEAAKAGESGKGFAVVAHEMNSLAAATKKSIGKINAILENINSSSAYVGNSINSCVVNYDITRDIFKSIKESFDIINKSANLLELDMKTVYKDVSLINSSTHEINQKSLLLHRASKDISNKTQEVAAVTEQELAELQEINASTSSLQNILSGIEKLVRKYRTTVIPVEVESKRQLRITFVSPLDHAFWYAVRQGVLYAIKELSEKNVVIDYLGFKENVGDQIKNSIKEAIENDVSGIIAPGFDAGISDIIEEAYKKNIPVMLYNIDLPFKSKRTAYVGPEITSTNVIATRLMVKALEGKGDIAIITGDLNVFVNSIGRETSLAELKKYRGIKVVAESQCADSFELSYSTIKDMLSKNSNIQGLFINGVGVFGAAKAIEDLGHTGKTFIICYDYNPEISEYIKKGIIYAAIRHDPFGQGHDPIIYLYNMLASGQKLEKEVIWTRIEVVDKNNVNDLL